MHVVVDFCSMLPESAQSGSRVEILWRTLIADKSSNGQHPAPKGLAESFKTFVMMQVNLHLDVVAMTQADESAARASIESAFAAMNCPSELSSMEEINQHCTFLDANWHCQSPQSATKLSKAVDLDRSTAPFESSKMITAGRRFFRTEKGLLGLGPVACEEGDQIWVVKRSHVPLMLRPTMGASIYTLVGECYIQVFMHGEMLDERWGLGEKIGPVSLT